MDAEVRERQRLQQAANRMESEVCFVCSGGVVVWGSQHAISCRGPIAAAGLACWPSMPGQPFCPTLRHPFGCALCGCSALRVCTHRLLCTCVQAALNRREYLQLEDQAAALQAQLQAAHREVADAHALLEATNSRSEVLEQAWNEALQASKVRPGLGEACVCSSCFSVWGSVCCGHYGAGRAVHGSMKRGFGARPHWMLLLHALLPPGAPLCLQDAQLAAADSRSLELALARAQEDAAYLNTQLEQSQHEAAEASAALAAARGRTAMLEKAYAQANEVLNQQEHGRPGAVPRALPLLLPQLAARRRALPLRSATLRTCRVCLLAAQHLRSTPQSPCLACTSTRPTGGQPAAQRQAQPRERPDPGAAGGAGAGGAAGGGAGSRHAAGGGAAGHG